MFCIQINASTVCSLDTRMLIKLDTSYPQTTAMHFKRVFSTVRTNHAHRGQKCQLSLSPLQEHSSQLNHSTFGANGLSDSQLLSATLNIRWSSLSSVKRMRVDEWFPMHLLKKNDVWALKRKKVIIKIRMESDLRLHPFCVNYIATWY